MDEHTARRLEETERDLHLAKHRLTMLEQEQLPRRVASMEPVVQRLEEKVDDLHDQVEVGFREVKDSIIAQKALQKAAVTIIAAIVGFVQLLPYLEKLLK